MQPFRGFQSGIATLLLCSGVVAQQPTLQIQGEPYFGGSAALHVTAPSAVGQPVILALGLNPLPLMNPVYTSKGAFYIGHLVSVFTSGVIGANGRLDVPFIMPATIPGAEGTAIPVQAYVAQQLSNPATVNLDAPYLLPQAVTVLANPLPSISAHFGDRTATGDFNGDGINDMAVGAFFQKQGAVPRAGRVYLFWGPAFTSYEVLDPPVPTYYGVYGLGLIATDVTTDGIDDLVVFEASGGDPPTPGAHGKFSIFKGGAFTTTPWAVVPSIGTAIEGGIFGRVSAASDVDDDGFVDIIVGTPDATVQGKTQAGRIEIYYGPAFANVTLIENPEPKKEDFFGSRIEIGDVTGDGLPEIIEASGRAAVGGLSQAGRLHVISGLNNSILTTIDNPSPLLGARFGEGLHAADLDGDGMVELMVADVIKHVYIVWDPLVPTMNAWVKPPSPNPQSGGPSSFGYEFSTADVNDDGLLDVAINDPFDGDLLGCGLNSEGGVIYFALAPYFSSYLRFVNPFPQCGDEFGWSLNVAPLGSNSTLTIIAGNDSNDVGAINAGEVILISP